MAIRTITVKVSRTVQAQQYEPVTVEVTETIQVREDDDHEEAKLALYKTVTQSVKKYLDNEILKASKEDRKKTR